MKQIALSYYEHPYLILIPLIIFFLFFIYLLITVMRKSNVSVYKELADIPLKDEEDDNNEQSRE